jgi:hypothetical protein
MYYCYNIPNLYLYLALRVNSRTGQRALRERTIQASQTGYISSLRVYNSPHNAPISRYLSSISVRSYIHPSSQGQHPIVGEGRLELPGLAICSLSATSATEVGTPKAVGTECIYIPTTTWPTRLHTATRGSPPKNIEKRLWTNFILDFPTGKMASQKSGIPNHRRASRRLRASLRRRASSAPGAPLLSTSFRYAFLTSFSSHYFLRPNIS